MMRAILVVVVAMAVIGAMVLFRRGASASTEDGVRSHGGSRIVSVVPPSGWDSQAETAAAMAVVEAERSRLGIGTSADGAVPAPSVADVASLPKFSWNDREKSNEMNLVFAFREGRVPVRLLWRHRLLNPSDRAPGPEDRAELERLAMTLESAMASVASKLHLEEASHRAASIESGMVKEYTGDFVPGQILVDGKAYLSEDFPPSREVEDLRAYMKFVAAESLACVLGYFVSRGYTEWSPLLDDLMVKSVM